jgi:four helix bundle protein
LAQEVYAFTATSAARSDEDFCRDIRRASRSAPANIAEGFGRETHRDFAHFLSVARASLLETENHLAHARSREYLTAADHTRLATLCKRAIVATTRLIAYLRNTPTAQRART